MVFVIILLIVVLDQISKYMAFKYLKGNGPYIIVKNFFQFHYIENSGAAFGILQNKKAFFIIVTSFVIIGITFFLFKHFHSLNNMMKLSLAMLMGGTIGNFIDRLRLGYVIDFISVKFGRRYDFPVFNIADIFIVIGTILIMYLVSLNKYEI